MHEHVNKNRSEKITDSSGKNKILQNYEVTEHMPATDNITLEKYRKTPGNPPFSGKCSRSFSGEWTHIFTESRQENTW